MASSLSKIFLQVFSCGQAEYIVAGARRVGAGNLRRTPPPGIIETEVEILTKQERNSMNDVKEEIMGILRGIGTSILILIILASGLACLDYLTKL